MSTQRLWGTVGHCGPYQVGHVTLTQLARMLSVWGLYLMIFGSFDPGWECRTAHSDANATQPNIRDPIITELLTNSSSSNRPLSTAKTLSHSTVHDNVQHDDLSDNNDITYNGTCNIIQTCSDVKFDPKSSTIVTEFQLICDKEEIPQLIISFQMFGFLLGALYGGQVGERFGRKAALYSCTAIVGVASCLSVFSSSWIMFAILNCVIQIGTGGLQATATVFSMEVLNPWWRGIFCSIPIWNGSLVLFALVSVALKNWRYIHIAITCLAAVTLAGSFFVSESVQWLILHRKKKEAQNVILRIARVNGKITPDPEVIGTLCQEFEKGDSHINYTYLHLFKDRMLRYISLKLALGWTCMIVAYYAMGFGVKSLPGDFYTNLIIGNLAELPPVLAVGPLSNKIGRPWAGAGAQFIASVVSLSIVGTQLWVDADDKATIITILALIAKAFSAATLSVIVAHATELYPTAVRNLGMGFALIVSRIGSVMAPYLIPKDMDSFPVCFSIVAVLMIICGVSLLSLPDTKSRPLADTITIKSHEKKRDTGNTSEEATSMCNI